MCIFPLYMAAIIFLQKNRISRWARTENDRWYVGERQTDNEERIYYKVNTMLTGSEKSILLSASWWARETTNIRQPKSEAPRTKEVRDLILILRSKVWNPGGSGVCRPGINPESEEEIPELEQIPPPTSCCLGSLHGMLMLTHDGKVGSLSSPHWSRC